MGRCIGVDLLNVLLQKTRFDANGKHFKEWHITYEQFKDAFPEWAPYLLSDGKTGGEIGPDWYMYAELETPA
jgi:hypothetical protein